MKIKMFVCLAFFTVICGFDQESRGNEDFGLPIGPYWALKGPIGPYKAL